MGGSGLRYLRANGSACRTHEPLPPLHPPPGRHFAADAGHRAGRPGRLPVAAALRPAAGRLPHHPGTDALPRCQPRGDERNRHRAARAQLRPDVRPAAHELDQRGRRVHRHAAVRPGRDAGRGRAGGAGRHQRRWLAPAGRSAGAAGVRKGEPGRRAGAHAGHQFAHPAAHRGAEPRQHAARAEDQPGLGRGPRHTGRRAPPGDAHSGRHAGAGFLRPRARQPAHGHLGSERQQRQGQLRRSDAFVQHQCQRPVAHGGGLPEPDRRVPQRRAGAAVAHLARGRVGRERAPRCLGRQCLRSRRLRRGAAPGHSSSTCSASRVRT